MNQKENNIYRCYKKMNVTLSSRLKYYFQKLFSDSLSHLESISSWIHKGAKMQLAIK